MPRRRLPSSLCVAVSAIAIFAAAFWLRLSAIAAAGSTAKPPVEFERDVAPIFLRHCAGCHNPSDKAGGLSLMSRNEAYAAGKSGEPAVKPGNLDESYIITRIDAGEMPPPGKGKPLAGAGIRRRSNVGSNQAPPGRKIAR